jgi:hypothetical protein
MRAMLREDLYAQLDQGDLADASLPPGDYLVYAELGGAGISEFSSSTTPVTPEANEIVFAEATPPKSFPEKNTVVRV